MLQGIRNERVDKHVRAQLVGAIAKAGWLAARRVAWPLLRWVRTCRPKGSLAARIDMPTNSSLCVGAMGEGLTGGTYAPGNYNKWL